MVYPIMLETTGKSNNVSPFDWNNSGIHIVKQNSLTHKVKHYTIT